MVNENSVFSAFHLPWLGLFILAVAGEEMPNAISTGAVQYNFYVGLQGVGKMVCFDSFITDDFALEDEDAIYEYMAGHVGKKSTQDKAVAKVHSGAAY